MTSQERTEALLIEYAAGALPPAAELLVETHTLLRPGPALRAIGLAETTGGALLEQIAPAAMAASPLLAIVREKASGDAAFALRERCKALISAARVEPDAFAWRSVAPGLRKAKLPLPGASLIRIAAGRGIPEHGHSGEELTLVLAGSFSDEHGRYGLGDIAFADADTIHHPAVTAPEDCVCLLAETGAPRFTSPWMRAASFFMAGR